MLADTGIYAPLKNIKFLNHTVYAHNTAQNHSGVAILIRQDIQHSLIKRDFEGDTVAIKVETTTGPIIVATNYTPPSRIGVPIKDLTWFARHRTPVYLLADLNAHHSSYDTFTNPDGTIIYNRWLRDGFLNRLGPEIGTFTTQNGNVTKPTDTFITIILCQL